MRASRKPLHSERGRNAARGQAMGRRRDAVPTLKRSLIGWLNVSPNPTHRENPEAINTSLEQSLVGTASLAAEEAGFLRAAHTTTSVCARIHMCQCFSPLSPKESHQVVFTQDLHNISDLTGVLKIF